MFLLGRKKHKDKNTEELVILAQQDDTDALEELIKRNQDSVYASFYYLNSDCEDILDLTQEALLKMARNIKKLKEPAKFKPWLNQIVTNIFYDYIKKHAKDKHLDVDNNKLLEIKDKIGCEPGEKCLFSEMEKLIKAALLNLPENLRIAIILREYEGMSYNDISKITNTTLGTVKSRISRARLKLQEELIEFI